MSKATAICNGKEPDWGSRSSSIAAPVVKQKRKAKRARQNEDDPDYQEGRPLKIKQEAREDGAPEGTRGEPVTKKSRHSASEEVGEPEEAEAYRFQGVQSEIEGSSDPGQVPPESSQIALKVEETSDSQLQYLPDQDAAVGGSNNLMAHQTGYGQHQTSYDYGEVYNGGTRWTADYYHGPTPNLPQYGYGPLALMPDHSSLHDHEIYAYGGPMHQSPVSGNNQGSWMDMQMDLGDVNAMSSACRPELTMDTCINPAALSESSSSSGQAESWVGDGVFYFDGGYQALA